MKCGVIVQARLASTRLPGKVLMDINGKPMLAWVVDAAVEFARAFTHPTYAYVVIASPDLAFWVESHSQPWQGEPETKPWERCYYYEGARIYTPRFTGSDVLREYYDIATQLGLDHIIRLTGDCPMLKSSKIIMDWKECESLAASGHDFYYYRGPDGMDVEICSRGALEFAHTVATGSDREHVMTLLRHTEDLWRYYNAAEEIQDQYRSVNTAEDLSWVRERMKCD